MKTFVIFLLLCGSLYAADSTNSVADIIQFGATNSTLIVSGKFGGTAAGGGGATSQVEINKIFQSPRDFQTPKQIAVSWFTGKYSGFHALQLTNSYIFFLRPHTTNSDTAYRDVTDMQPFVEASEANISVLKSHLADDPKTDDWGAPTNNLQMCIKLGGDMNEAKVGQSLDLIIRIRNLSTNETYFWIEPHTEVADALYKIIVTAPSGKNVSPTMPYVPMAGSGATRSAEPGGTNVCDLNLEKLFRFEEVGTYRISAQREILGPIGAGGVRSNGLTITTSIKEFKVSSNPLYVSVVQ